MPREKMTRKKYCKHILEVLVLLLKMRVLFLIAERFLRAYDDALMTLYAAGLPCSLSERDALQLLFSEKCESGV